MNYFRFICFAWAFIGITSRIVMGIMGSKWKKWELNSIYMESKPKTLYLIGILGYFIVVFTWYKVMILDIPYSWVIAVLISFIIIKISAILFNYNSFRSFISKTLNDRKKMFRLNLGVIIFSIIIMIMGIFLY